MIETQTKTRLIIRDAVEADLPAIVAIYNSTVASRTITADLEPVSVDSRLQWFHDHAPHSRPLWVVDCDGEIAGWLGFKSFYSGRRAYDATAELSIYISADFRRRGIGGNLLHHAIATSPKLGIQTLVGFIFADNHPSLKLFQQFGFEQWGYLPGVAQFETGACDLAILGRTVNG